MEQILVLLLAVVTGFFVFSLYFRKGFVESYVRTSPKAYVCRQLLGVEKTILVSKWVFAPLGTLVVIFLVYVAFIVPNSFFEQQTTTHTTLPQTNLRDGMEMFSRMGFFKDLEDLSIEHKVEYIQQQPLYDYVVKQSNSNDQIAEPILLAFDSDRVWWSDTDRSVENHAEVYVDVLYELSGISNDVFAPLDIFESWKSDKGPIMVEVEFENDILELELKHHDGYIDLSLLEDINMHMSTSGYSYWQYKPFDQTALVFFLSESEAEALKSRGWEISKGVDRTADVEGET